jgi:hypothetical protein
MMTTLDHAVEECRRILLEEEEEEEEECRHTLLDGEVGEVKEEHSRSPFPSEEEEQEYNRSVFPSEEEEEEEGYISCFHVCC